MQSVEHVDQQLMAWGAPRVVEARARKVPRRWEKCILRGVSCYNAEGDVMM